jgi:acyltransferase
MAGAAVGLGFREAGGGEGRRLAAVGALIVAATCWTGVGTMPANDPILVVYRIGVFLLLVGLLTLVPTRLAARVAPLGRASLAVYAIHVPMVYGWSTHPGLAARVGARLGLPEALLVALGVLLAALAVRQLAVEGWATAVRLRDRLASAAARGLPGDGASSI